MTPRVTLGVYAIVVILERNGLLCGGCTAGREPELDTESVFQDVTKSSAEEKIDEKINGRVEHHEQLAEPEKFGRENFVMEMPFNQADDLEDQFGSFADDENNNNDN